MARYSLPLIAIVFSLTALAADDPLELTPLGDTTLTNTETDPPNEAYGLRPTLRLMTGKENHRIAMIFELKDQAARPCMGAVLKLTTDKSWPGQKSQLRVYRLVRPFSELQLLDRLTALRSLDQCRRRFRSAAGLRTETDQE